MPLKLQVIGGETVSQMLRRMQSDTLEAFQHEEYPYEWIMRDLGWRRGPERTALFDVMIALDSLDHTGSSVVFNKLTGLVVKRKGLPRRSREADLQFGRQAGRIDIAITYNAEIFAGERIQGLLEKTRAAPEALAKLPGTQAVSELRASLVSKS